MHDSLVYQVDFPFTLESGIQLERMTIAYSTYGKLNKAKDNAIWVCHALTGNTNPLEWWSGLVGEGKLLDPDQYFIVCANMLGSCYGTTGPDDLIPGSSEPYGLNFPLITTRDMARAHQLLAKQLGLPGIYVGIGGSMGGQQLLEWSILAPDYFKQVCFLATNARHSAWGIAFNESQRMAMKADPSFGTDSPEAGRKGLEAARAIAMLSYRHYQTYDQSQTEANQDGLDDFKASSYQQYQGRKLWQRFSPAAYWTLSKAMDNHNVGRGRGTVREALQRIKSRALVIGIDSDLLFPVAEQSELAEYIPDARFEIISSDFGHDGFLTETQSISLLLGDFLRQEFNGRKPSNFLRKKDAFRHNHLLPGSEGF